MSGKLFAIGTGPGSSDLITVRGARVLAGLNVVYTPAARKGGDSLALSIVREYLPAHVTIKSRHFPMNADAEAKESAWDSIAGEMAADVRAGAQVGFITLGDVMLFSTWVFLLTRLQGHIPIEIIPGVTSFSCIAARTAFPLAMEQQSMAVVSCTAEESTLADALMRHECVVLMKVYGRFAQVRALLERLDLLPHALLMSSASLPDEQCIRRLADLDAELPLSYFSTILVNKRWLAETDAVPELCACAE